MKKNSTQWFAIVIGIWVILIITLIAFYILEFIIPFARNVRWLENATVAYYQSVSWVENALFFVRDPANGIGAEDTLAIWTGGITYGYDIISNTTRHPELWEGDSEYDSDWWIIAPWKPLQIYLPRNLWPIITAVRVYFRVPNFDNSAANSESFDISMLGQDIINWQLASPTNVLNSRPVSWIYPENRVQSTSICGSTGICNGYTIHDKMGFDLLWSADQSINTFYTSNCTAVDYQCILKFTVINDIVATSGLSTWKKIPYLEYYIDFDSNPALPNYVVPNPNIRIDATWMSFGYRKNIEITFPQKWLFEAFDFTVFQ